MHRTFCQSNNQGYNEYVLNIITSFNFTYHNLLIYLIYLEYEFAKQTINGCNMITTFFKRSHIANKLLADAIITLKIEKGGLKIYCETRWTSMYEAADSISHLRIALEYVSYN